MQETPALDAFAALDIRMGTIVSAEPFPEARKPAYKLTIAFGEPFGVKHSSAQLTSPVAGTSVIAAIMSCQARETKIESGPPRSGGKSQA